MQFYTLLDVFLGPLYIMLAFMVAWMVWTRNRFDPRYRYLRPALTIKLIGTLAFCAIYTFYYGGGDTTGYFYSSGVLINLLEANSAGFFEILFGDCTPENFSYFTPETGYPWYWMDDAAFAVVKLTVPIRLLGMGSFLASSIVLSCLVFVALWRLYITVTDLYNRADLRMAIAVLMIPSVTFWAGGILKDSYTLLALAVFITGLSEIYLQKKFRVVNILAIVTSILILATVKVYILLALMPAVMVLFVYKRIQSIRNILLRLVATPLVLGVGLALAFGAWSLLGAIDTNYAEVDQLVFSAHEKHHDLKQDYYGGSSFDIGDYDPTVGGALSKFPQAVTAGLFRPYLWESRSIVMVISGLENLILLAMTLIVIFFRKRRMVVSFGQQPFQVFCLSFVIVLAFIIGISTSNFGSLVRFKIPLLPFMVIFLISLFDARQEEALEIAV